MASGTESYAAAAHAETPAWAREALPADQAARSEALAAEIRAGSQPPPVLASGPPPARPTPPAYLPAPAREPALPPAASKSKSKKKFKLPPPPASAPVRRRP
jgi:hypothetical protein